MVLMKDKRGMVFFFTLMLGTTVIILGLAFADPIQSFIDSSRADMHCSYSNLSLGDESTCVALDIMKPAYTGAVILLGIAILGAGVILR